MPPSLGERLAHILTAIDDIRVALEGRSQKDFTADLVLRLAIERMFEIMSEASRHVPDDLKAKADHIQWKRIADLGNWLRHAYHRVDPEILWNIARNDLEPLRAFVAEIVRESESKS